MADYHGTKALEGRHSAAEKWLPRQQIIQRRWGLGSASKPSNPA